MVFINFNFNFNLNLNIFKHNRSWAEQIGIKKEKLNKFKNRIHKAHERYLKKTDPNAKLIGKTNDNVKKVFEYGNIEELEKKTNYTTISQLQIQVCIIFIIFDLLFFC